MKLKLTLLIVFCLPVLSFSQGFKVVGTELRDANNNPFIMKGVNVPLAWYEPQTLSNIGKIKKVTGANTLRLVVGAGIAPVSPSSSGSSAWNTKDAVWQAAFDSTIKYKMIPMLEVHNILGSNDSADLKAVTDWWISKKDYLTLPGVAKYLLINIANEWGDWQMSQPNGTPANQTYWRDSYIASVKKLRAAGIKSTLVIDAPGYGQDKNATTLLAYAKAVMAADPEKNLIFSIHTYCEWSSDGGANSSTVFPKLKEQGIPFFVGEFANTAPNGATSCDIPAEIIMANSVQFNSGYLAWSWVGNGGGTELLDMSTDWPGTKLTSWGDIAVNSAFGTKSAIEASVFGSISTNKNPTVSITAPVNNASFQAPATITINATASDSDGTVKRVDFYQGSTKVGTDSTAPFSFTWNNVAQGAYSLTAFAIDNQNGSGKAAPISILVTSSNGNLLSNGTFESGLTGWQIQTTAPGAGTLTLVSDSSMAGKNSLKICTTTLGTQDYFVMTLTSAAIIKGNKYQLTFLAKADSARTIKVGFQQNGGSYRWYTGQEFSITKTSQLYSYSFTADTTDPSMDIKFFVGLSLACVSIDDVVFTTDTPTSVAEEMMRKSTNVFPNPFAQELTVSHPGAFTYELRNQLGQQVEQGSGAGTISAGRKLEKGFYILRVSAPEGAANYKINKE